MCRNKGIGLSLDFVRNTNIFELDFLFYLCRRIQGRGNIILINDKELGTIFKKSRQVVGRLKQKFRDLDFLKYRPGMIFVNPDFVWDYDLSYDYKEEKQRYLEF